MAISLGRLEVETADHVLLRYTLAGAGNRGFAALVDFTVATILTIGLALAWEVLAPSSVRALSGYALLLMALLGWSYFIVLEWIWNGQTIGKRLFGLRVIGGDGAPAGFGAILVRNIVRVVDFLPGFYGLGLAAIVLSSRSQRLGDLAAGTFVIRAPRARVDLVALSTLAAPVVPSRAGVPAAAAELPSVRGLSGEAQRLVREFVARAARLSPADRAKLAAPIAAHLRERLPEAAEPDDVALIYAVARSLRAAGER